MGHEVTGPHRQKIGVGWTLGVMLTAVALKRPGRGVRVCKRLGGNGHCLYVTGCAAKLICNYV